jgi:hypothetical protein
MKLKRQFPHRPQDISKTNSSQESDEILRFVARFTSVTVIAELEMLMGWFPNASVPVT